MRLRPPLGVAWVLGPGALHSILMASVRVRFTSKKPTAVVVDLSIVGAAEREIVGSTHDRYLVSE